MNKLSDNYYGRKCYFKRDQVPTQSVMINKMGRPLANIYFKSMNYKLRVLAGFEPPMKGGGSDWFIPPEEVLKGRVVLQPTKKQYIAELGSKGVIYFGELLIEKHRQDMEEELDRVLIDADKKWKEEIEITCRSFHDDKSKVDAERNTLAIHSAFREFIGIFTTSLTNIESLLMTGAVKEIQRMKREANDEMRETLKTRVEVQAHRLYASYAKKLDLEKQRRKDRFIKKLEKARTIMATTIHDLKVEKHSIVEKLRHFLQSLNLACQVYVGLKEKVECKKEMGKTEEQHKVKVKHLKETLAMKDFEIRLAQEKERKRMEFNNVWKRKVCEVVKKLQMFVTYCLSSIPEYADFFIDMEKLMLIQLSEVYETPKAESVFEPDGTEFHTPVPQPHPFYLVCDKGFRPKLEQGLCPKHCTSSASQLPVIVVNKRCIYASCDNFEQYTAKVTDFVHGRRGDDIDFQDDHDYALDVPIKHTSQDQIEELKLQSSILQIIQAERPNLFNLDLKCCNCNIPYCFCKDENSRKLDEVQLDRLVALYNKTFGIGAVSSDTSGHSKKRHISTESIVSSGHKLETRSGELLHEREPKMNSYLNYLLSKKCRCAKFAKRHLAQHLPPYMITMSKYEQPELPNYEMCSVETLKKLVRRAQKKVPPPPPPPELIPNHRDISTQYSDEQFEVLCTCLSDDAVDACVKAIMEGDAVSDEGAFKMVDGDVTPSFLTRSRTDFATSCAHKLRNVLDDSPQLQEIFMRKDCNFN